MMIEDKYSVLMSVYYDEKPEYFKASIESMIGQSLIPNQIVIVKDGELTEELNEIINKFEETYPDLFTIVAIKENVGLGLALNEGLKRCRNELVARMDTDDISIKERCELQVQKFMSNKHLSIVGSLINEFVEDPNRIISSRIVPLNHEEILKFSKRRNPFNHPTVMYKKSEVLKLGGYGNFRRNQDLDLFVRMLNKGLKAININQALVLFRANESNLKRRKSWEKCSSYIDMIYNFWRKGYSTFTDLIIVTVSQVIVFLAPIIVLEWISNTYLRKVHIKKEDRS